MAHRSSHRHVRELHPFARASQQQTTSAHISAADKLRGKRQTLSKNSEQGLNIFWGRDTTQQNDFAIAHVIAKYSRVALQGNAIPRFAGIYTSRRNLAQFLQSEHLVWRHQTSGSGNHSNTRNAGWWIGMSLRVGQFAAEVQSADETENFSQRHALIAKSQRQ